MRYDNLMLILLVLNDNEFVVHCNIEHTCQKIRCLTANCARYECQTISCTI